MLFSSIALCLISAVSVFAFSSSRNDNLAVYWGQDGAGRQQSLGFYCNDDTIDTIPLAFLYTFFGPGGMPVVDFSNICSGGANGANCAVMASDIKKCQAKGKLITLSLGGATANVGFNSANQASAFAKTIWDMFLGGSGPVRPFGSAVLDGVDLDIENGGSQFYDTFVNSIHSLANGASKRYYVTAAPQCPFPDEKIGQALSNAHFDAVYVQFYNNYCETSKPGDFNFATWDNWAKTKSPNKDIKVYLGVPGSPAAAGSGYVDPGTLANIAKGLQKKYSSFGGVMMWDADTAYNNNRFHVAAKNAIRNGAGSPPDAPAPGSSSVVPTSKPVSSTSTKVHTSTTVAPTAPTASPSAPAAPSAPASSGVADPHATARVRHPHHHNSSTENGDEAQRRELLTPPILRRNSRFFKFHQGRSIHES